MDIEDGIYTGQSGGEAPRGRLVRAPCILKAQKVVMGDRCVGFHMISYDLHTSSADGGSPVKSYSVVESRDPPPVDAELHERRSWPSGTGHCFTC